MSEPVWSAAAIASACGGDLVQDAPDGAGGFAIDTREVKSGDLFIGVPGARVDGGALAADAFDAGAWGVLVRPLHAEAAAGCGGAVVAHPDPVAALGRIAEGHLRRLSCRVIGVTGSSGKTSTKDILASILAQAGGTVATRGNRNTEIGMPLEILRADAQTRFLVLEMAMRGRGQIAELARIAKPDVGVIVSIGPAHLDLLGSIEEIAAAKSELIAGLEPGRTVIIPAGERLLEPHLRPDLKTVRFGPGGDVKMVRESGRELEIDLHGERLEVHVNFDQPHNRLNLLAALAAAGAVGVRTGRDLQVAFSALRGDRLALSDGIVLIDDCYNSNPSSLAAGLSDLAAESGRRGGRSVAVLGDMLELGPAELEFHRQAGCDAAAAGVGFLVTVGRRAESMADGFEGPSEHFADAEAAAGGLSALLKPGDTVLIKGSRGVGLEAVARRLKGMD